MIRHVVRALVVVGLVGLGWAVGQVQAQAPSQSGSGSPDLSSLSDFELVVSSADNGIEVRCVRGCRLTWAPAVVPATGPVDLLVPDVKVSGAVNADGCVARTWSAQNCRVLGWQR